MAYEHPYGPGLSPDPEHPHRNLGHQCRPGCGRVTDPDLFPAAAWAHMTPWAWVAAHGTQVSMGSAVAQLSGTKKATGWEPRPGHQCGVW